MINKDNKLTKHCLFCEPEKLKQKEQILLRSDNFYLFAGLGPIVKEGYIIIAPYKCDEKEGGFHSFADMPHDLLDEVVFLRHIISKFYKDKYGIQDSGMHFEHGRAPVCIIDSIFTKHCHHAHLCCYPKTEEIWKDIKKWKVEYINGLCEIAALTSKESYLLIQASEVDEKKPLNSTEREKWNTYLIRLEDDESIESQYLRKLYAQRIGKPKLWDWMAYKMKEEVNGFVRTFKNWIELNSKYYSMSKEDEGVYKLDFIESVLKTNSKGNNEAANNYFNKWKGLEQYTVIGQFLKHIPRYSINTKNPQRPVLLDAGCGPGTYLNVFNSLGINCVGIDISEKMLKIAASLLTCNIKNVQDSYPKLYIMDTMDASFGSRTFDAIWCSAVFVHLPRIKVQETLDRFYCMLKPGGVAYFSAQDGFDSVIRYEGRMYFYYPLSELTGMINKTGFTVAEQWQEEVSIGTYGDKSVKYWNHFILKKPETEQKKVTRLIDLGERKILDHILSRLPDVDSKSVAVGVGDDCAAIKPKQGEMLVVTSDPCPKPVITYFENTDFWYYGWYSMIINISDLGAMGAEPVGILLALEAENTMPLADLDRFYEGVLEAANLYGCPIIGGNVKDARGFNSVGSAMGSISPNKVLERNKAKAGELVVVLGDMGYFWTGVMCKLFNIELEEKEKELAFKNLKKPIPRIKEGRLLASKGLSKCAMDSSDGLISCFYEIAKDSDNVDIEIDFTEIEPDPIVKKICKEVGIDHRKVMLSWGDWELVCTVRPENLPVLKEQMKKLKCPVHVVGKVDEGKGKVIFKDKEEYGELNYMASERFSSNSYFSNGIKNYFFNMKNEPLIK